MTDGSNSIATRKERINYYALKVKMIENRMAELEVSIPKEQVIGKKLSMQNTLKTNREMLKIVKAMFDSAILENKAK